MTSGCGFLQRFPEGPGGLWAVVTQDRYRQEVQRRLLLPFSRQDPLCDLRHSSLCFLPPREGDEGSEWSIKLIRPQKAADYFRRYHRSQGKREYRASRRLLEIGLRCPDPIAYGVNLLPWGRHDSFLICRYLSGTLPGNRYLHQLPTARARKGFLEIVAGELALMLSRGYYHKDAHLGNILVDPNNPEALYWIDNDLKPFAAYQLSDQVFDLLERFDKRGNFVSRADRKYFEKQLCRLIELP